MSFTCYQCSHIGVSGTTPIHIKVRPDGTFEARMGGSMMGTTNMTEEQMDAVRRNPFHEDWHDNYFCGKGKTQEEAIEAMKKDMQSLSDLLFA